LETFVTECLNIASKSGHASIAFPSLGTGKLRYPVDKVAQQMFSCVDAFSSSTTKSSVKQVLFVIYNRDHNILQVGIYLLIYTFLLREYIHV
jgi:O-acetyl-ADP-ribose deacetylase (regulator of RNase III)